MSLSRWEIDGRDRKAEESLKSREEARRKREDMKEARELGLSLDEYLELMK